MVRDYDDIEISWASVGAAFGVEDSKLNPNVDPEQLVVRILKAIPDNPRYAPMFVWWLEDYKHLLDISRLKDELKKDHSLLAMFQILSKSKKVEDFEDHLLSPIVSSIMKRALDERLLPLAKSKIKPVSNMKDFNIYFSARR